MDENVRVTSAESLSLAEKRHKWLLFGASSNVLTDLLATSHDCVIFRDKEGGVVYWNRAAEQLYGWTASEARGQTLKTFLKTTFPKPWKEIESELYAKAQWEGELAHVARDGRTVIVASRLLLQADREGAYLGILQLERDLTEQRRLEQALGREREELEQTRDQRLSELGTANEALVESQTRFHQIGEAIHDVVWLTNRRRTSTIYVNRAYEEIWGRSCQSLYADPHSWLEGVHPEDRSRLRRFFSNSNTGESHELSYRVVRPDCSVRCVLDRGFAVRDNAGGTGRCIGIIGDVTERKELEKEMLAISEREQRRIGQDLHDDLCQQLAGIEFLSRALQEQLKAQPQAAKAGEIAKLIREAINYTRQLARGLAPVELAAEGLMRSLQALATRTSQLFKVACVFECQPALVVQDPIASTHLYRIAQEAVANSIKHGQATQIEIVLAARPEGGELTIHDNGKGLPSEAHFSTGMGLRIMRYRADIIVASFRIESRPSAGTTIVCVFPLTSW